MNVVHTLTYENDLFHLEINAPTMKNAAPLIAFGREYLQKAAKDELSAFPGMDFMQGGVDAIKPLIVNFHAIDDAEEIDLENLSLDAANFLASVAIEHYAGTLKQSAVKKK